MNSQDTTPMTEEQELTYTRQVRQKLIDFITTGDKMPDDPKVQKVLLTALADMDKVTLVKKKIKSDEGISSAAALAAETVAKLFLDPRLKNLGKVEGAGTIPKLDPTLPPPPVVDGELEEYGTTEDLDSFNARMAAKRS